MQSIAVILAGGSGKRAGGDIPKQFRKINGKTILEYSIGRFEDHDRIDEIMVVGNPAYLDDIRSLACSHPYRKVKHILPGGAERYHSVLAALEACSGKECLLLIHDAVRPVVSRRIISDVIEALAECHAVNVAIPATDTIIETDPAHEFITQIPDRSRLYQVQTPQGFHSRTLAQAYALALADPDFTTTDDCSVVRKYLPEEKIKIVPGEPSNMKYTYAEDLVLLEYLLKLNP